MSPASAHTRSLLVADHDEKFIETLRSHEKTREYPLLIAGTGTEAQRILADRSELLVGVFVSPELLEPSWISVVKCAHMNRPATPLFFIQKDHSWNELTPNDLRKMGIKGQLTKPVNYADMVNIVAPIALRFDAEAALAKARENTDTVGEETAADGTQFMPIRATDFLSGSKSFFDVYVRLSSGKQIKLLQAGDSFTADRLEGYLKKGVTHFYIRKDVQEQYVGYCDHIATALLKNKNVPIEMKNKQVMNHGDEVMKHMAENGVSEANIKYATKFVSNTRELISQMAQLDTETDILSDFMADVATYEHGIGTSMLASILAHQLQIASENPVQIIGTAAMLHDIGLTKLAKEHPEMSERLKIEDEGKMDIDELMVFRTHPSVAMEELSKIPQINPSAIQAIEQHHMRIGGKGFPERKGTTPVNRVAEIIGICDELNLRVARAAKDPNYSLFTDLEVNVFPFFSQRIVQAVKSAFYPARYGQAVPPAMAN